MGDRRNSTTAVAPCSTANLGPGYDVFGLALDALEDKVTISRTGSAGPAISIVTQNDSGKIPISPELNSAGRVVQKMALDFGVRDQLAIKILKGVPAGYGAGSSAASAAAAALAFKALYRLKIDDDTLVEYAAEGEIASAGSKHYDNVSASLLGGFVITSDVGVTRKFIRLKPPRNLALVIAVPLSLKVPERKTEAARAVLPKEVNLRDVVHNVSAASTIVAGFALGSVETIASGIDDVVVEPARKHLVPGYEVVKRNALEAGALAVTISGAGPSMIAFMKKGRKVNRVVAAMKSGFISAGIGSTVLSCGPSNGARLI